jgi:hypothetical protein
LSAAKKIDEYRKQQDIFNNAALKAVLKVLCFLVI